MPLIAGLVSNYRLFFFFLALAATQFRLSQFYYTSCDFLQLNIAARFPSRHIIIRQHCIKEDKKLRRYFDVKVKYKTHVPSWERFCRSASETILLTSFTQFYTVCQNEFLHTSIPLLIITSILKTDIPTKVTRVQKWTCRSDCELIGVVEMMEKWVKSIVIISVINLIPHMIVCGFCQLWTAKNGVFYGCGLELL